jgi:hypothetical protein
MSSPGAGWCRDAETLDALARQTADYLRHLHGVGRRFGTTSRPRPVGRRTWLHAYADCARFWFLPIEDVALISTLSNSREAQPFQNPQAQTRMQQWWHDVTQEDAEHRHRATRLARAVAEALDPPTSPPVSLDRRRVYALYADRRRLNRLYAGLVDRFQTPPPISWLPVVPDHEIGHLTMCQAGWAHTAAVKFLAAFLGSDENVIREFVERPRPRR